MDENPAPPNREILRLAIPNILSNVSVPLLSTVDTLLMGQLSALHLGAVGLGSMIFNFIYWNFGFLRMGTTGLTAQAYGAQSAEEIRYVLGRALMVSCSLALLIVLLQAPLADLATNLMQVHDDQDQFVRSYFDIRIWAAPATLAIYVLTGWLFGMQNSVYPLIITIVINVANIILSYLMVMIWDMEIAGVAWSTVIAQYVGVVLCLILMWRRYRIYLTLWKWPDLMELKALKTFFRVNGDLFIRTVCLTFVFAFFYSESSALGATLLAVNVILLQLVNWASYGIDGFAFAAESVVGKYHGAADGGMVHKMIRLTLLWGFALGLVFTLIYAMAGDMLVHVFSEDQLVLSATEKYLWYAIAFPVAGFLCYIWDGIYIGLTASKSMRNTMVIALAIFFVMYHFLPIGQPNHLLWTALIVFLLFRGLVQTFWYVWKRGAIR
ncbi:MAG: MATE family efflux transporter [Saprospiraceae bacterium]|nr:MATE family efflux transporter [Saprospiraceae bacterium]